MGPAGGPVGAGDLPAKATAIHFIKLGQTTFPVVEQQRLHCIEVPIFWCETEKLTVDDVCPPLGPGLRRGRGEVELSIHTEELASATCAIVEQQRGLIRSRSIRAGNIDGGELGPAGTPARIAFEEAEIGLVIQRVQFALSGLTIVQE